MVDLSWKLELNLFSIPEHPSSTGTTVFWWQFQFSVWFDSIAFSLPRNKSHNLCGALCKLKPAITANYPAVIFQEVKTEFSPNIWVFMGRYRTAPPVGPPSSELHKGTGQAPSVLDLMLDCLSLAAFAKWADYFLDIRKMVNHLRLSITADRLCCVALSNLFAETLQARPVCHSCITLPALHWLQTMLQSLLMDNLFVPPSRNKHLKMNKLLSIHGIAIETFNTDENNEGYHLISRNL